MKEPYVEPYSKKPSLLSKDLAFRAPAIAFLIGSLDFGGAEGQLIELLRRLDRSRWTTSLVLFEGSTDWRAAGVVDRVYSLGVSRTKSSSWRLRGWKAAVAITKLTTLLLDIRPDVLHAFLPASFVLAAPAAKMARVPLLVGSRRSLCDCYRNNRILACVDRLATRACDCVIGNSSAVSSELTAIDGLLSERTATIHNGVDTARFRPGDRSFRAAQGWTDENVVFGIVANFLRYKRHSDFICAAARIVERAPQARFVMAGEDRGTLSGLRSEIANSGLVSRFTIIPGTSEPEKLYPAMDAYICTSETEGFSNVLLEAAACGLPLIATAVGGNEEIVFPGKNGYLVPVNAPEKIAQAALALIGNAGLRLGMGFRSRELVRQRFSLDSMVRQYEELYDRLLAAKHGTIRAVLRTRTA
jgi:glycosyltransferase involved in cell wall biosynthesis